MAGGASAIGSRLSFSWRPPRSEVDLQLRETEPGFVGGAHGPLPTHFAISDRQARAFIATLPCIAADSYDGARGDIMVSMWAANTDPDWFDFLASEPNIDEVNFWQPSGQLNFHAIRPGELFLFKLKSPRNVIGGFGVFSHASNIPISLAWEAFGVKNGAHSYLEMRERVGKYRAIEERAQDFTIGCRIVVDPVFFPPSLWVPQPSSWSKSTVVGKSYDTSEADGRALWDAIHESASLVQSRPVRLGLADEIEVYRDRSGDNRYGPPTLVRPRLGQGAFRIAVTDAYARQCAISGGRVLPALEAAHIKPYAFGGEHDVSNGILLRRDIHSVFDAGYITFDEELRLVVSDRVRTDFNNGNEYRRLAGAQLSAPLSAPQPSAALLGWHREHRYLG